MKVLLLIAVGLVLAESNVQAGEVTISERNLHTGVCDDVAEIIAKSSIGLLDPESEVSESASRKIITQIALYKAMVCGVKDLRWNVIRHGLRKRKKKKVDKKYMFGK